MARRWNPEDLIPQDDFEEQNKSWGSIIIRILTGAVVWVLLAFVLGMIVAAFCLGIYFVTDVFVRYVQGAL